MRNPRRDAILEGVRLESERRERPDHVAVEAEFADRIAEAKAELEAAQAKLTNLESAKDRKLRKLS